jgi:WD40 repeat protein
MRRATRRTKCVALAICLCMAISVRVWFDTRRLASSFGGHSGIVFCVAFSPDGTTLASGGMDGTVRLLDPTTAQQRKQLLCGGHVKQLAFSPDSHFLAVANGSGVQVWDVNGERIVVAFSGAGGWNGSVDFSPRGDRVAAGCGSNVVVWDIKTETEITRFAAASEVQSVAFSTDASLVASGDVDGHVNVWDLNSGKEIASLGGHGSMIGRVIFSPDGQVLVSQSWWDSRVKLWDLPTLQESASWQADWRDPLQAIAISRDSGFMATGSGDSVSPFSSLLWGGEVKVWDMKTTTTEHTFNWHWGAISDISFSPDGKYLATSCYDGRVRLWSLK